MEEKPSQEFVDLERHHLLTIVVRVVLPPRPDTAVAMIDEPIIREGDAVGIASEVGEHLLGAGAGPFRVHHPVDGSELSKKAVESVAIGQFRGAAREGQLTRIVCAVQASEILRPKDRRHRPDGKQE